MKIITQQELYEILPFGKTKVSKLIQSGELPLVKVGKDYITTEERIKQWIDENIGHEIYY